MPLARAYSCSSQPVWAASATRSASPRSKRFPASASALPNYYMPSVPCMRLSDRRLGRIVRAFGQAAADASAMGLDGVYLHMDRRAILEHDGQPRLQPPQAGPLRRLAPLWPGRGARDSPPRWGPFPISMPHQSLSTRPGGDLWRGGARRHLPGPYARRALGRADARLHGGARGGRRGPLRRRFGLLRQLVDAPPAREHAGGLLRARGRGREERFARDGVKSCAGLPVPVVAVGKLGYPDVAERALREGACDMVMLGRPLLAGGRSRVAQQGLCGPRRPDQAVHRLPGGLRERVRGGRPPAMRGQPAPSGTPCRRSRRAPPRHAAWPWWAVPQAACALVAARRGHEVTLMDAAVSWAEALLRRCRPDEVRRGGAPIKWERCAHRGREARRGAQFHWR